MVTIKRACQLCKVSRSGYYAWLKRPVKTEVDILGHKVKSIFKKSKKTYGTRRIKKELANKGIVLSHKKISCLMSKHNLVAKARRKTRITTDSKHNLPVAPNLLNQQFDVDAPNKIWVGDISYLATSEGWLYLAVVIDLYSRKVVGWSISNRMTKALVLSALMRQSSLENPIKDSIFIQIGVVNIVRMRIKIYYKNMALEPV